MIDDEIRRLDRLRLQRDATEADLLRLDRLMLARGEWEPWMVERRAFDVCRRAVEAAGPFFVAYSLGKRPSNGQRRNDAYDALRLCARQACEHSHFAKAAPVHGIDAVAVVEPDRVVLGVLDEWHGFWARFRIDAYAGGWRWSEPFRAWLDAEADDRFAAPREAVERWAGRS